MYEGTATCEDAYTVSVVQSLVDTKRNRAASLRLLCIDSRSMRFSLLACSRQRVETRTLYLWYNRWLMPNAFEPRGFCVSNREVCAKKDGTICQHNLAEQRYVDHFRLWWLCGRSNVEEASTRLSGCTYDHLSFSQAPSVHSTAGNPPRNITEKVPCRDHCFVYLLMLSIFQAGTRALTYCKAGWMGGSIGQ
jgi:hypothetical protein